MERNISKDLSVLTTIDDKSIDKLFSKITWCISDLIEKTIQADETEAIADLGFGKLVISIVDNQIKYRFEPSQELESSVIDTVVNERNLLTFNLEKNLVYRITHLYKDMF